MHEATRTTIVAKNEFSFCMIDLDGLKYANDNYGHASGDRYLKTVADDAENIAYNGYCLELAGTSLRYYFLIVHRI